ncbi:hypothetical protein, partial [Agrococcus versicolor]|uniref:hypothetical protein n=1 Tax=Agrococcus versicolor TaxID=501482 RepID=UPI0031D55134
MLDRAFAPSDLPARRRHHLRRSGAVATTAAIAVISTTACAVSPAQPPLDPPPASSHVHDLAFSDEGNLLVATHGGLFEVPPSGGNAQLLGGVAFDAMGLAVLDRTIYASGHPGPDSTDDFSQPNVGLMAYQAAEWASISAAGDADFHLLATSPADPNSIVAMRSDSIALQVSTDAGQSWVSGASIEARDVAIDAGDANLVVATTPEGLMLSSDGGMTMTPAPSSPLLVTISPSEPGQIIGVAPDGQVWSGAPTT